MSNSSDGDFSLKSSIPVMRMLDEVTAKAFYVDYLGFEVDWEHRFRDSPNSPLYLQIHKGDAVLHLNGHAEADSPVCEVRIPVQGLDRYCEFLRSQDTGHEKPEVVDPRHEGRKTDMNIVDPSGNLLIFWSPSYFDA